MVAARHTITRALSQSQATLYICRSCRHQLTRTSRISIRQQRFASSIHEESPTTDRSRRKTGDEDHQVGTKVIDRRSGIVEKRQAQTLVGEHAEDIQTQGLNADVSEPVNVQALQSSEVDVAPREYVEAENWEGLQFVGSRGHWLDVPATVGDEFQPWIDPTSTRASSREELENCMRQALVDCGLMFEQDEDPLLDTQLDMEDPSSFEVLKRFSQLSNHRIPDPTINTFFSSDKPLSYLVEQLMETVVRPKPRKIADLLMERSALNGQSNVMIFPRRETSIDKEKEVGRWKVIERELKERGLPAIGTLKSL